MGGGTNISHVYSKQELPLNQVISRSLDNFGEEQGYGSTPYPGRPYMFKNDLFSKDEAYNILNTLNVTDAATPIVGVTEDYVEEVSIVSLPVDLETFKEINRYYSPNSNAYRVDFSHLFGSDVVSAFVKSLPEPAAPKVVATEGDLETIYVLMQSYNNTPKVIKEYASYEEAVSDGMNLLNEPNNSRVQELYVEVVTRVKEATSKVAVIKRDNPDFINVEFEVTKHKVKPNAKISGYCLAYHFRL